MYVSLIQNAALLVALGALYSLVIRLRRDGGVWIQLLAGLLFGGVAVAGMLLPFRYGPGIIYDGRSIILAMAGLFGGGTGSVVSIVVAGTYRAFLGGPGIWAGLATIIVCPLVGLAFRRAYRDRPDKLGIGALYGLGVSAHVAMLACQLLVQPWPAGPAAISRIWLPIMLIFPAATLLVGLLLGSEVRRVHGARELQQAREYAENLIQTANVIFVQLDTEGKVARLNEAAERITGYRLAEIQGKHWFDTLVPKDDYPHTWERINEATRPGMLPRRFENPIVTRSGEERYVVWQNSPLGNDGEVVGTISFGTDITERKQAEKALQESERQLTLLLANLPGMAYRCANDPDCTEFFVSQGCLELTGYEVAEIEQSARISFNDLIHPDDRQRVREATERGLTEHRPYRFPYRIETATGEVKWVWDQGSGVYDAEGDLLFLEGFIMDISDKVRAEESLRERDEQLRQSQKMEAVGQLAGGIAHDFNNLLTAILGYSEMILSDVESQGLLLREDVGEIKRAAERAAALTRQILAFSRRQALKPVVVSLNEVLVGMEPLLRRTLGEDVDLVTLLQSDLGQTEVDVHQFEQVLLNLAVNARDAMPAGGQLTLETADVELDGEYCRTHAGVEPGRYVMLLVSDTGMGMDKETQSHMFEPFFTTKEPGAGTGLGLSTVYGIVRQSGGTIDVESELGSGTTFRVYLPRVIALVGLAPIAPSVLSSRGHETILVVEDEDSLRTLVTRILGGFGYTVVTAATAGEALEILEETEVPFDLLLTDVVLPGGMQGSDLARSLHFSQPELPVLYMSGYTRDAITHAGRLDEGVNYLAKPFTPDALGRMVRTVLDQARASSGG
jgi:two-component system, cell cycle sensor histidine kinase and response regulator CckA